MEINLVTFSPTHTGRTIAEAVAAGFSGSGDVVRHIDLTLPGQAEEEVAVAGLAVFAAPVYGGRVAETAAERFGQIRAAEAGRTPAILTVVYGNRDYEDALVELRDIAVRQGFVPLSAGAFVGEHSYSRPDEGKPIAQGRPDEADRIAAEGFGRDSRAKYEKNGTWGPLTVKGCVPYKVKGPATPATPVTEPERCTGCGICVGVCPTGVVGLSADGMAESAAEGCIKCCACLKFCPAGARRFDTPYTERLFLNFSARREPELFL